MTGVVELFLVLAVVVVIYNSRCTILSALNSVRVGNGVPSVVRVETNMSAKRGRTMVDVLGRLQEAFAQPKTNPAIFAPNLSLENSSVQPLIQDAQTLLHRPLPCSSAAAAALKLYGPTSRAEKQREISRAAEKELRERDLYHIKQLPTVDFPSPARRNVHDICLKCDPSVQSASIDNALANMGIRNALRVDTQGPHNSYFIRTFCYLARVWQLKKYEYKRIYSSVLEDERLRQAIKEAADMEVHDRKAFEGDAPNEELYQKILEKHRKRAVKILGDMASKLSDFMLRIKGWLLYKMLPSFLSSVIVHRGQVEVLKAASKKGLPLIILPLHRSHLDYILLSFILLDNEVKCPLVAAGDNLRIPFFGAWLRGLGAFYIRRKLDPAQGRKDVIYRTVLHSYMTECLRANHNMEFFIEGGRTRTGKPCLPKGGLLSVIIEAHLEGVIDDALLVPASLNYDRLVDGNFVREQLGQPKIPESFFSAVRAIWTVITSHYGMIRMDFGSPYSLKELMNAYHLRTGKTILSSSAVSEFHQGSVSPTGIKQAPSSTSLYGTDIVAEERRYAVESIARHVIYDCARVTAYMSTNMVAFLLLNEFRNGVPLVRLADAVERLRERLADKGRDVGYTGDSLDVVNHAINLLGPGLIVREKSGSNEVMVYPVTMLPNVIELSYYSNCMLPVFAMDSAVVRALCSLLAENQDQGIGNTLSVNSPRIVTRENLMERTIELCDLLQYELVWHRPCGSIETVIEDHIDYLVEIGLLKLVSKEESEADDTLQNKQYSHRVAKYFDDHEDSEEELPVNIPEPTEYEVCLDASNEIAQWLLTVGWRSLGPIIDMYIATVQALARCLINGELIESEMTKQALSEMKFHLEAGISSSGESISVDTVRGAFRLFEKWGVLDHYSQGGVRLLYLTDRYNDKTSMKQVYYKLERFRKEFPTQWKSPCPSRSETPCPFPIQAEESSSG